MEDKPIILYIEFKKDDQLSFNASNLNRLKNISQHFQLLDLDNYSSKKLIQAIKPLVIQDQKKIILFNCELANAKLNSLTTMLMELKQEKNNTYYLIGSHHFLEKAFSTIKLTSIEKLEDFI